MKFWIICVLLLSHSFWCSSQTLAPFKENGKFGFRTTNKVVIPARFDYVSHFSRGLALVRMDEFWGYINESGNWVLKPQFDAGQPFSNSLAYVRKAGKMGLIDSTGRFVIEPEFDEIIENYSGYQLFKNGKEGYLSKKVGAKIIPAVYDSIEYFYGLEQAKTTSGQYDLFIEGEKKIENLLEPVRRNDINYYDKIITVGNKGLLGLYHFKKGWIAPVKYQQIDEISCSDYQIDGEPNRIFNKIYVLHTLCSNCDIFIEGESDSIIFLKKDGTKLSDQTYDRYESLINDDFEQQVESPVLRAWKGSKLFFLNRKLEFEVSEYSSYFNHLNWVVAEKEHKAYILNQYKFAIDSFDFVSRHRQFMSVYDEEMFDMSYREVELDNEPFLIVTNGSNPDDRKSAIYDLNLQQVVSPWMTNLNWITRYQSEDKSPIYMFGSHSDTLSVFISGMKTATAPQYAPETWAPVYYATNGKQYAFFRNILAQKTDIYENVAGRVKQIGSYDFVNYSHYMMKDSLVFDPEINEPVYAPYNLYKKNFLVIINDGKYGLIGENGHLIAPQFDSLIESEHPFIINTMKNGKYGSIDISNGKMIQPISETPLKWLSDSYNDNVRDDYTIITPRNGAPYYLGSDGKKFRCRAADVYLSNSKKKHHYLFGFSGLDENDSRTDTIALFRKISYSDYIHVFMAQNMDKKWGLIDFRGDTLIPFLYDEIRYGSFDMNTGEIYYITRIGKKKGIITLNGKTIVPAEYDNVTQFEYNYELLPIFEIQREKAKGLIGSRGEVIFEAKMDQLEFEYKPDSDFLIITGKKQGKLYSRLFSIHRENYFNQEPKPYDFMVNENIIVKKGEKVEVYNFETGNLERILGLNEYQMEGVEYNIFIENGKYGAKNKEGQLLIAAEYDFAQFFEGRDEVMVGWQNGIKYYIYVHTKDRYTEQEW